MYHLDCLLVEPFPHEVLRRLIHSEEDEPNHEFDERDSAHDNDKVSPAHVCGSGACGTFLAGQIT